MLMRNYCPCCGNCPLNPVRVVTFKARLIVKIRTKKVRIFSYFLAFFAIFGLVNTTFVNL